MPSKASKMAEIVEAARSDTKERTTALALALQARAWRILAFIAMGDKRRAVRDAKWLFWVTVPFVNAVEVQKYIDNNEKLAEKYGIEAGVFAR